VVEYDPRFGGLAEVLCPWMLAKKLRRIRERIEEIVTVK
jgi:hypothetical protein